jgi:Rps23 Pro-64 3,4-dihydroxylase Tpa1-like proline 4-hydroxylase
MMNWLTRIASSLRRRFGTNDTVPYLRINDFLSREGAELMLREMIDRRKEFHPRGCNAAGRPTFYRMTTPLAVSPEFLRCFERIAPVLEEGFGAKLEAAQIELLGQAYGDGGSFAKHSDADAGGPNWQRRLSGVYYLHAQPKKFTGGGLAVYDRRGKMYVVDPDHNSALFFSRDLLHEVLLVTCASHAFEDSRFAVNVWIS